MAKKIKAQKKVLKQLFLPTLSEVKKDNIAAKQAELKAELAKEKYIVDMDKVASLKDIYKESDGKKYYKAQYAL